MKLACLLFLQFLTHPSSKSCDFSLCGACILDIIIQSEYAVAQYAFPHVSNFRFTVWLWNVNYLNSSSHVHVCVNVREGSPEGGGTAASAPPPFRPGNPALFGSCPLVTPYYCRQGDLLCYNCMLYLSYHFVCMHVYFVFSLFSGLFSFVDFPSVL